MKRTFEIITGIYQIILGVALFVAFYLVSVLVSALASIGENNPDKVAFIGITLLFIVILGGLLTPAILLLTKKPKNKLIISILNLVASITAIIYVIISGGKNVLLSLIFLGIWFALILICLIIPKKKEVNIINNIE